MSCIVADLGGTFLRCAVVAENGELRSLERHRLPGDSSSRIADVWNDIIETIGVYSDHFTDRGTPIAFAFPGPIHDGRTATNAPTVLGSDSAVPDIVALLSARTRRSIFLINDVSAAAWYFSERVAASRFAVVTISSGIGAKIFDRRHQLGVLDDVLYAGELGHIVVDTDPGATLCDCGGRGHLGAIASARAVERRARNAALSDSAAFARSMCVQRWGATVATLTNEAHLVPAIQAGDPWSTGILQEAIPPLGRILHSLTVGCGLDGIVLMGGFAQNLGDTYLRLFCDALAAFADRGPAQFDIERLVTIARPNEEPSLVGAATYARLGRYVA